MSQQCKVLDAKVTPRSELVRHIRNQFGITQAQLAEAMGTSLKAIQSYEQGWRNVPTRVLIQIFVLLAIQRSREIDHVPCWEITDCPVEDRNSCPSYTVGQGQFCWFISGRSGRCGGLKKPNSDDRDNLLPCMGCEVIRRLLPSVPVNGNNSDSAV